MRFFGGIGLASFLVSGGIFIYLAYLWFSRGTQRRPIFWLALGLALAGLLFFLVGFLAELIVAQGDRLTELEQHLDKLIEQSENQSRDEEHA
jgi:hypothetical protein